MDWHLWLTVVEVCANMLMFFSLVVIAVSIFVLISYHRIGMALGRTTWAGLALFLLACGLVDLFKVMVVWLPSYWPQVGLEAFVSLLGVIGAIRMTLKVREVRRMTEEELTVRFEAYHSPLQNLRRMRELLTLRESGEPTHS